MALASAAQAAAMDLASLAALPEEAPSLISFLLGGRAFFFLASLAASWSRNSCLSLSQIACWSLLLLFFFPILFKREFIN